MARLYSAGFELNSTTANVEFTSATGTIVTTNPHTGTYSGAVTSLTSATFKGFTYQFLAANGVGPYFFQFWLYIITAPSANTTIAGVQQNGGFENLTALLTTTRTLELFTQDGAVQIGSASSAIPLNTWTCIEIKMDDSPATGSKVGELRVNQVVTATSSTLTSTNYTAGVDTFNVGGNLEGEGATTFSVQFDDITINDSTTSFNNTYAGGSQLLRYSPSAAGDSNTFATNVGGTAGGTNNFTRVDEVTPDNATSYNASITAASDLFAVAAVGGSLPGGATINGVVVGGRVANITGADTTASLQFQIEQKSGGTIQKSGAIIPDTVTWSTNSKAIPHNYPLTAPQDPTNTNWTATTIGTMQIGYLIDTVHTDADAVSTIWAYVDYTPSSSVSASVSQAGATLTFTGGTQVIVATAIVSATISQAGATLTFNGGTQLSETNGIITQSAATLTFTGGAQAIVAIGIVGIGQVAATLTFTGGAQTLTAKRIAAITQAAATLAFTGGVPAVASIQDASIAQTHATLTFSGGTQAPGAIRDVSIAQIGATITFATGTQAVTVLKTATLTQLAASLIFSGGAQSVSSITPVIWVSPAITLTSGAASDTVVSGESIATVQSGDTIEDVTSGTKTGTVTGGENSTTVTSGEIKVEP